MEKEKRYNSLQIEDSQEEEQVDIIALFVDSLRTLKDHFVAFLIFIVAFAAVAAGVSYFTYKPLYRTNASFSIIPLVQGQAQSGLSVYKFNYTASFAEQLSKTFPYIAKSNNLHDIIQYELGRDVSADITANAVKGTNVFEVSITSDNPADANDTIDSLLRNLPKICTYVIGDIKLDIIYQSPKAVSPINGNNVMRNSVLGAIGAIIISFAIAFIISLRRDTINEKEDIRFKLNSKYLCGIPFVNIKRTSKNLNSILKMDSKKQAFSESVRVLKKRVLESIGENEKIFAVTSTKNGEGKTTIAFNLATALQKGNKKVALVDLDLYTRDLQKLLLVDENKCKGISEYCLNKADKEDIVVKYKDNFDIVFSGLGNIRYNNKKIKEFLDIIKDDYDYIIVDTPACGIVAGSVLITDACDDILFVVKRDETSVSSIKNALRNIVSSNAKILGFIINDCTGTARGYSYYGNYRKYGYRYHYRGYTYHYNNSYKDGYYGYGNNKDE